MTKKTKILVLADSPLVPSGVGTQTKYMIEAMLKTGRYSFVCLAGAMKHADYRMQLVENPYVPKEDWIIWPVDGYGDPNKIKSAIIKHRPDVLWFMTDPRFYTWLWEIEDEIRPKIPMIYYHVWDNYPYPKYNKKYYDSNDIVCTISKVTDDIVRTVSPDIKVHYLPHTVDTDIFKKNPIDTYKHLIEEANSKDKMVFFWNNRNARRKQSGTLIWWFNEFLKRVGKDKACLIMHTEPKDQHGQDLEKIIKELDLEQGEVLLSVNKMPAEKLAEIYNLADCTINIADAEGFGLSTLESLACETPIIVNMTGGLQEQVTNGQEWFGIGLEPSSKSVIGSQDVPYIYEDRLNEEDFINAMVTFYNTSLEERQEMGRKGRKHVLDNYGMKKYADSWVRVFDETIETMGSWSERKNYKSYKFLEIK